MKVYRKLLALICATAITFASLIYCSPSKALATADDFVSAADTVAAINVGWNLGNTLDSYGTWISGTAPSDFETAWGNPTTTEAMIESVHNQGFNAIRIPVTWSQHIDENGNVSEDWMNRVKTVVDYAYNLGMYVILNVHHDTGEGGGDKVSWIFAENDNYSSNQEKFSNLWTNIANEFIDYDNHLLFEGYNEMLDSNNTWNAPTNSASYEAVNSYAQLFVDTVRATGGNNSERNLIVNTYVSSVDNAVLDNFVLPTDSASNHLITEVHVYAPWGFTGTSASVNWTTVHSDFGDSDRAEIDDIMNRLESFGNRIGTPVIIGECGAEYKNNDDQRASYAGYLISTSAAHGIKCFWWDNGDYKTGSEEGGYAIYNRSTGEWRTSIVDAMISNSEASEIADVQEETAETSASAETSEEAAETAVAETSSIETTATQETSLSDATAVTSIVETSDIAEPELLEPVAEPMQKHHNYVGLYIGIGIALVILSYVGLFFLGRHNRNKKQ